MAFNNVYRQLHGEIIGETDKAIKFEFCIDTEDTPDDEEPTYKFEWFPLSQLLSIHRFSTPENNESDILMVSEWILKQKGISHLAGSTTKPVLSGTPTTTVPKIQDKLAHPPTTHWADMDDDIPF